ncbi:MAG: hypothetical protein A3F40_04230, partial [Chlamydiae bacterium RIFCSPHIGHO2_12_FULL_27_8]
TGADFTCYPASSMNEKDFFNLFEVYIDAVFYPIIDKKNFMQEGHRLEFAIPNDPGSPLMYKGVVYNEMKGANSSIDSIIFHKVMEHLLDDLTYKYNSGGDTENIPKLTHEQLVDFHKKFYNQSNAIFFLYGDIPLEKELDFIEKHALENAKTSEKIKPLNKQKRFQKRKIISDKYPIEENSSIKEKDILCFAYLTTPIENQLDLYALLVLDNILMGTDASILKRALLESKLCKSIESLIDQEISEIPYFLICKDLKKENKDKIFKIIEDTFENILKNGISESILEASLHQLEFSRTEISNDQAPYGLTLFFRSALLKQHGVETENALVIHTLFEKLRKAFKDKTFLENFINKYFLKNSHMVTLILEPDTNLIKKETVNEIENLQKIKHSLDKNQIENLIKQAKELDEYQKSLANMSFKCLPKLVIEDIPKKIQKFPLEKFSYKNFDIFYHDAFTNDIIYFDLVFDIPKLEDEEFLLLPLFTHILTEIGTKKINFSKNLERIEAFTGGIHAYSTMNVQVENPNDFSPSVVIKTKCLKRNAKKTLEILKDMILDSDFNDFHRIKEIILQEYSNLESSFIDHCMKYSTILSHNNISIPSYINSKIGGYNHFKFLKKLCEQLNEKTNYLTENFKNLFNKIFIFNRFDLVVTCSKDNLKEIEKNNFFKLLENDYKTKEKIDKNIKIQKILSSAIFIAAPVAFNASSYRVPSILDDHSSNLLISSKLFENVFLHTQIREIGGAYGAKSNYNPINGVFTFTSYRDPHIKNSLEVFKKSIKFILDKNFTDEDLFQAKLGIIQKIDLPLSPGSRGAFAYFNKKIKKTDEIEQNFRNKLLKLNKEDIAASLKETLVKEIDSETSISFCSKEIFLKENPNLEVMEE